MNPNANGDLRDGAPHRRMIAAVALTYGLGAIGAVGGALALPPIISLAALIAAPWKRLPGLARRAGPVLWLAALIAAWFALSMLWTPATGAPPRFTRTACTALAGVLLAAAAVTCRMDDPKRRTLTIARLGVGLLFALLAEEALFNMPLNRLGAPRALDWELAATVSRGVACFALFVWGTTLGLLRDARAQIALAMGGALATALFGLVFEISAAPLAAALGLAVWLAALVAPRFVVSATGALLTLIVLGAPLLGGLAGRLAPEGHGLPFSWEERLEIWSSAAAYAGDAPIIGLGFDASRAFPDAARIDGEVRALIPLHPHNFGLQVWLEGGAVGALLFAALIVAATRRIARIQTRPTQQAAAALAASWAVFASLSFGAWQEWWIAAAGAAAVLVVLAHRGLQAPAIDAAPARL